MISLSQLILASSDSLDFGEATVYECQADLNLYDDRRCDRLATQAAKGRYLRLNLSAEHYSDTTSPSFTSPPDEQAEVLARPWLAAQPALLAQLCEDDYPGWIQIQTLEALTIATAPYQPVQRSFAEIQASLPGVIHFTQQAMQQPNEYLWGGTVGPNYDCSGLMQAAFASVGIWLPRDAYQQEAFTQAIPLSDLQPGDLIFFGTPTKATHVGLALGNQTYIHSSGKDQGRNGIGLDVLSAEGDPVSQTYFRQLRGVGRVVASYQPQNLATNFGA